jgi:hypothetical protein
VDFKHEVPVTRQTSPPFLAQAEDGPVDNIENSLVYFAALKKANVPVEMHIYAHGGPRVWATPHRLADHAVAGVDGGVAGDAWNDLAVATHKMIPPVTPPYSADRARLMRSVRRASGLVQTPK